MEKDIYERADLEIIKFQTEDVILTSGIDYEEDELPFVPNRPKN